MAEVYLAMGMDLGGHAGLGAAEPGHTGSYLAAASGASTKDLMTRMGHSSIYLPARHGGP